MRIKKFEKLSLIEVLWKDTTSECSWTSIKDIPNKKSTPVKTVGYFLCNKKGDLILLHSITYDGDGDYTIIPHGCVSDIKELGVKVGG